MLDHRFMMRFKPYTGPQRTLHTHFSTDECLRRLCDEVISPWLGSKATGWQPFKRDRMANRDRLVYRHVNGHQFQLRLEAAYSHMRGVEWRFYGDIRAAEHGTQIVGHYHIDIEGRFYWWLQYAGAALFGVLGLIIAATSLRSEPTDLGMWFTVAICVGLPFVLLWPASNDRYQHDETYLVESLKKVLEAEEM